ncbi:MAG: glycosyltransferase family 2 protein [Hyphomonadaceae bacterium]|nr:glycosyltransferase family 2 protein [Hyphomonadaceae bacterium]
MEPKAQRSATADAASPARVSAIVVTYHTGDSLELCLRSLFSEPWIDEVIIVDNGNPAPVSSSLRALQADRRDVTLVQGQGNVGFARACNLGAELASGRHLLFVNPDAVIQRGAAERMAEAGRRARSPWIVGGRLVDKRGREQRGARRELLTPWTAIVGMLGLGSLEVVSPVFRDVHRERDPKPDAVVPMPVVSGALMMMPRADFIAVGGFDEGYFLHVEDIDLCRRVGEAGGAVLFEPGAEALHFGATSHASWVKVEAHKARGMVRYFEKFAASPAERVFIKLLAPVIGAAMMVRGFLRSLMPRR